MAKGIIVGGGGGAGSDGLTAEQPHVLAGHTAITKDSNDEPAPGTMPNFWGIKSQCHNLWWNKDGDGNLAIAVQAGFHGGQWDNGSYEFIPGQTLRNVIGATDSARILAGTTIAGLAGTMPIHGGQVIDPRNYQQVASNAGHYCANPVVVNAVSNLAPENIRRGVIVGGVTGTWEGFDAGPPDLYNRGANPVGWWGNDRCRFEQTFIASVSGGASIMSLTMGGTYNFMHYTQLHVTVYNATSQNTPFRLLTPDGTAIKMDSYWSSVGTSTHTFALPEVYRTTTRLRIDIGLSPGGYISRIHVT